MKDAPLNFEGQLTSEGLTRLALTSQELYAKLQDLLQKASTPEQFRLLSYSLLTLAYECCREAFGAHTTLQINKEYSDKLQAIVKDAYVKHGVYIA